MSRIVDRGEFCRMWMSKVRLREIAEHFGISWHVAAKLRATYGLPRRVVVEELDDIGPDEIRLRAMEQRTNWTPVEAMQRWCGKPHTIYSDEVPYGG